MHFCFVGIKGHQLYYNFFRPHFALNNETPAKKANIDLNLVTKMEKTYNAIFKEKIRNIFILKHCYNIRKF